MTKGKPITPEEADFIRSAMSYDPNSGFLTWNRRLESSFKTKNACNVWNSKHAGRRAGALRKDEPVLVSVKGRSILAHRIAWLLHYREVVPVDKEIDHINGDNHDNRICNLRMVTNKENSKNQKVRSTSISGIPGVTWDKSTSKWMVRIGDEGRDIRLGRRSDFFEAACMRKSAEIKYSYHENHGRR